MRRLGNSRLILSRILNRVSYLLPGGASLRPWLHRIRGAHIGRGVWISQMVYIDEIHPEAVTIGDNCTIGLRSSIIAHLYWGARQPNGSSPVTLGDNVFVGPHCLILPGAHIGEGSVVQGGSVVSRHIPPHTLWGTSGARPLGNVSVPLTAQHSYDTFIGGLNPVTRNTAATTQRESS